MEGAATDGVLEVVERDAPVGYENNRHRHPPSDLFDVVSGETTPYVDGESGRLTRGTRGFVPGNNPHGFQVSGGRPLRVLAVFAPAGMATFFREVGTSVDSRALPRATARTPRTSPA